MVGVGRKLTAKQKMFVAEYLVDLNATAAAIRARYSEKTARQIAARLLSNVNIQEAIQEALKGREKRTEITIDKVLKEYARLGFLDPRKFFNADGSPRDITELDDDTAAALAGFEVMEVWEGQGDNRTFVGYLKKYKLVDKKGALDSIGKHLGMFTEKMEITGKDGGPVQFGVVALPDVDEQ